MSIVVEIGHPDVNVAAQADRVNSAIAAAGFDVEKPFAPDTGLVTLAASEGDADEVTRRLEQELGRAFPAFVEMNPFYVKVTR